MFLINRIVELRHNARLLAEEKEAKKKAKNDKNATGQEEKASEEKVEANAEIVKLVTPMQYEYTRALKETWKRMQGHTGLRKIDQLLNEVFLKTFEQDKRIKTMLMNAGFERATNRRCASCVITTYDHARFLSRILDYIVEPGNRFYDEYQHSFGPTFIGRRHRNLRSLGFVSDFWEQFGQNLAAKIVGQHCVRGYPYGMKAWSLLCAMLTDRFRAGFEQHYNIQESLNAQIEAPFGMKSCSASAPNTPKKVIKKSKEDIGGSVKRKRKVCFVEPRRRYKSTDQSPERRASSAGNLTHSAPDLQVSPRKLKTKCIVWDPVVVLKDEAKIEKTSSEDLLITY